MLSHRYLVVLADVFVTDPVAEAAPRAARAAGGARVLASQPRSTREKTQGARRGPSVRRRRASRRGRCGWWMVVDNWLRARLLCCNAGFARFETSAFVPSALITCCDVLLAAAVVTSSRLSRRNSLWRASPS